MIISSLCYWKFQTWGMQVSCVHRQSIPEWSNQAQTKTFKNLHCPYLCKTYPYSIWYCLRCFDCIIIHINPWNGRSLFHLGFYGDWNWGSVLTFEAGVSVPPHACVCALLKNQNWKILEIKKGTLLNFGYVYMGECCVCFVLFSSHSSRRH